MIRSFDDVLLFSIIAKDIENNKYSQKRENSCKQVMLKAMLQQY